MQNCFILNRLLLTTGLKVTSVQLEQGIFTTVCSIVVVTLKM